MNFSTIFLLLGGLGLFLFGMKLMSDGLEQAAGARMRSVLEFFTKNRLTGMIVGILFTAVIQSSSATTVMVVSFVNSGLMTLYQAAGVILGANIGTTVTGQLIAFNLSELAPLFVMVGVVLYMFCKGTKKKRAGMVILGFGVLFMGLSTMSSSMAYLKDSPQMLSMLSSLTNPFMAILFGFVITAILQSSSATVGIVILMAQQGLLELHICLFLILGCNMGSCVSALLASIGGKKDAKRAAWIHFLFNIVGSSVMLVVFLLCGGRIAEFITSISGGQPGRAVANAHTLIKVFEVIMLFAFMGWIVRATYHIVPGTDRPAKKDAELLYIGRKKTVVPSTAVIDVIHELEHMGQTAIQNVKKSMQALCDADIHLADKVYEQEEFIDYMNREITDYLVHINGMELPYADAELIGGLFRVANDLERIGDHAENFADAAVARSQGHIEFSEKAKKQLSEMTEIVEKILQLSIETFSNRTSDHLDEIRLLEDEVDAMEKRLQKAHVKRITKGKCTPQAGMFFSDTISGLERIADHATNIAFSILEPDQLDEGDDE